jgi:hypothetical protein
MIFKRFWREKKFLIWILGIVFLVLGFWLAQAPKAEAVCSMGCKLDRGVCYFDVGTQTSEHKVCIIGSGILESDFWTWDTSCTGSFGDCKQDACNTSWWDGASCSILTNRGGTCDRAGNYYEASGKWEASSNSCIQCIGALKIYQLANPNINYRDIPDVFSTACGADAACQGKTERDNCGGTNTCNASGECVAAAGSYTLSVSKAGTGSGGVTSAPAGINCGTDCSEPYTSGTSVTLTATPAAGSTFTGWSGDCSGTGSCSVTMNAAKSVTATFTVCPTGFSISFGSTKYSKTDNFTITYSANSDGCVSIDRTTGGVHNFWNETIYSSGSRTNYNTGVSGGSYASIGSIVRATINKSSSWTCDVNSTCKAEITIVECTKNSDCTSNDCDLTTNTCNLAATPCSDSTKYVSGNVYVSGSSITTGSVTVSCPSCSYTDSIVAGDGGGYAANRPTTIGEVCTITAVSSVPCGNSSSTTFTVTDSNPSFDFNLIPCAAGPTCAAGDGCKIGCSPQDLDCCTGGNECVPVGCTSPDPDCATGPSGLINPLKCKDFVCLIEQIVKFISYLAVPIAVLMIIIAAFLFMTAGGEVQKLNSAKNVITYTLIGLLIIILARALVAAIKYVLGARNL